LAWVARKLKVKRDSKPYGGGLKHFSLREMLAAMMKRSTYASTSRLKTLLKIFCVVFSELIFSATSLKNDLDIYNASSIIDFCSTAFGSTLG
jgi:hypothetical protein